MDGEAKGALDRRSVLRLGAGATVGAGLAQNAEAAVKPSDIVMLDAVDLATAIRTKRLSAVEVMSAYLDHIEAVNPKVNAIVALQDRGDLLKQAQARDDELASGKPVGPLHGLPHAVKDLQPVKGIRFTQGSPIF